MAPHTNRATVGPKPGVTDAVKQEITGGFTRSSRLATVDELAAGAS